MTKRTPSSTIVLALLILGLGSWETGVCEVGEAQPQICRPQIASSPSVRLGQAGMFSWTCSAHNRPGKGYYIVFVRPSGTYVLLKVPEGRTSFEFTPDTAGSWRWVVINTDPDRTRPDTESEPGHFQVIQEEEPGK